jgi:hypothetical protein
MENKFPGLSTSFTRSQPDCILVRGVVRRVASQVDCFKFKWCISVRWVILLKKPIEDRLRLQGKSSRVTSNQRVQLKNVAHALIVLIPGVRGAENDVQLSGIEWQRGGPVDRRAKEWDAFISHAIEDQATFVRDLATMLTRLGPSVWYSETALQAWDSLSASIAAMSTKRSPWFLSQGLSLRSYCSGTIRRVGGGCQVIRRHCP